MEKKTMACLYTIQLANISYQNQFLQLFIIIILATNSFYWSAIVQTVV